MAKYKELLAASLAAVTTAATASALATETVTYSYDARGRLVAVKHSGTANNNVQVNYAYDKADNRTNKTVTGAP
jgi:YD repeat-containing protein